MQGYRGAIKVGSPACSERLLSLEWNVGWITLKFTVAEATAGVPVTHSYRLHYFHLIWSTKHQSCLYPYLGAVIRNHSGKLLKIGGMPDHVHFWMITSIVLALLRSLMIFWHDPHITLQA